MHRHKEVFLLQKDGSYKIQCTKCMKILFSRPPLINQRKDFGGD